MTERSGSISINTENIFPIIKKWLYSEKDIFIRELVSNASDAINKLKKLSSIGEANIPSDEKYRIDVELDKKAKTLKFTDNGIGMTEEEVVKYINQIAFSGAVDFIEKYKDKADDAQIIGHFGLGFYSSFMVSEKVQIDTLSYQNGAKAVRWVSEEGTEFEITDSDRAVRGTTITLHIDKDSKEFLEESKVREVLRKYFAFLPVEIYFNGEDKPLNDTNPLWLKNPKECTDEEYKDFYHKVFNDFNDPLFWIHLNMEYPFTLKGILYFPRLRHEYETIEGVIKLYYNQVFVADNIKEVIPEFLMLLKGTIDCPDLPLNVSRSFLQNDGYVGKISNHITKKVSDKLKSLYNNDRENYNKYWEDINPFVKYGCMREEKFYDKVKDIIIFKNLSGDYITLDNYIEANKEKNSNKIFYVTDETQQAQYIKLFKDSGMDALILNTMIDSHFMNFLEMKLMEKNKESSDSSGDSSDRKNDFLRFARIDSELTDTLKSGDAKDSEEAVKARDEKFEKLFRDAMGNDKLKVKVEQLKATTVPGMILLSEQSRRLQEMSKLYGGGMDPAAFGIFGDDFTLVLNGGNALIRALEGISGDESRASDVRMLCQHIYDLAMMAHRPLSPEAMTRFIERSGEIMEKVVVRMSETGDGSVS